jgi:hypothetical protein
MPDFGRSLFVLDARAGRRLEIFEKLNQCLIDLFEGQRLKQAAGVVLR